MVVHGDQVQRLLLEAEKQRPDVLDGLLGLFQADAAAPLVQAVVPGKAQHPVDQPGAGRADALHLGKLLLAGFQHGTEAAEPLDQRMGDGVGVFARDGKKQQIFQRLVLGQAFQAVALDAGLHAGAVVGMDGF